MHGAMIPVVGEAASDFSPKAEDAKAASSSADQPRMKRLGEIVCCKSNVAGKVYSNTIMFDDYESLIKGSLSAYLYELRIMYDSDFIYGIQGFYQVDGRTVAGPGHYGREVHSRCQNQSLKLQYGECIVSISGNYQDVVNGLMITTSLGKTYAFGNYTTRSDTSK
mmetsp:Transcript_12960/g.12949  ORF Transcript_12960/g.12949 Transcript_12960/m.12949 type:complete len:165 (+) Transcript_12960:817-1311(+)|eukprot:CAMPEP_0196996422 /NCGR_PEP_ID=MMETSP1380-20130617/2296_1 /TAXON_ID=5936 /ORGANISM="Euplotes crassus, Strain CT5" /LENGTH=164 /DNA_ID=CAMNT_0042412371 /DNA_START=817 /DNA_END=1311 /DNA_ORIENTATION=+